MLRHMRVHLLTTIENRADYRAMARLWAFSIRRRAGALADAPISIACNESVDEGFAREMKARYGAAVTRTDRISRTMRYVNKYNALSLPEIAGADWVMFFDADTVVVDDLGPLAGMLSSSEANVWGVGELPCDRVFGLERLYERFGRVPRARLAEYEHPWNPLGLAYFNGGVWLVRGSQVLALRERVVALTLELFKSMRASSVNPLHWARVQWNRQVYKSRRAKRLVIEPYFPKFYSDQMAIAIAAASLGWKVGNLPRSYNWIFDSPEQGENYPIRVLHYVNAMYPLERGALLEGEWAGRYAVSGEPGKAALAEVWRQYRAGADQ